MPLVFVHGVNTREGASYRAGCLAKEAFFRRHLTGATVGGKALDLLQPISFPYWGDLGTTFAWDMASLPQAGAQALGAGVNAVTTEIVAQVKDALPKGPGAEPLTALAKKQFVLAVDALAAIALDSAQPGAEDAAAAFAVAAQAYATANPQPAWVATIANDAQLINRLGQEIAPTGEVQALGNPIGAILAPIQLGAARLKQAVKNSIDAVVDQSGDFASTRLLAVSRKPLNEILGRFFGDIFIYLSERGETGSPGKIPSIILQALDDSKAAAPNEPLVIVGHSLGGVITYDLLSHFRPDFDCDLFVTVGSQVGHFEEIKLYRESDPQIRLGQKARTPPNIKRWINVYDEVDIFAYACEGIFDRVDLDLAYDTQTYTVKAHGAYFDQDRFYQRLRARMDALG